MTRLWLKAMAIFAALLALCGIFCFPAPHTYLTDSIDTPDLATVPTRPNTQASPQLVRAEPIYLSSESPQKPIQTEETAPPAASSISDTDTVEESVPDGFILYINRTSVNIGFDTSEKALDKRPGWLNTSSYPGEPGVCLIYGHRNRRHLRALEKVEIGDILTITTPESNTASYIVSEMYVADSFSEISIPATDTPTLMLITCYPFRYTGSAPQKYVVIATVS